MNTVFHEETPSVSLISRRQAALNPRTLLGKKLLHMKLARDTKTADRLAILLSAVIIGICVTTTIVVTRPGAVDEQYFFDPERARLERLNQ